MTNIMLFAAGSSNAALWTFLIYMLAVFSLAAFSNKLLKGKNFLSEYFLGSRGLGVWAFALTFAATSASGGSFTGFPSKIYTHGWVLGLWIGSYIVVPICAMGLLGKRINQVARISSAITVPDILRDRFRSVSFGLIAVALIIFFMSFNLVAQFKSGSLILKTLVLDVTVFQDASTAVSGWIQGVSFFEGVDAGYLICLLIFGVAVIIYTTYGGFHAVVWTDVMQGIVMVVGVLIMLPLALMLVGKDAPEGTGALQYATEQMIDMVPPEKGTATIHRANQEETRVAIRQGDWLTVPAEPLRLFRVTKEKMIAAGSSSVTEVPVLEIMTPGDIKRVLENKDTSIRSDLRIDPESLEMIAYMYGGEEDRNGNGKLDYGEDKNKNGQLDDGEDQNNNGQLDGAEDRNKNGKLDHPQKGLYVTGPGPDPNQMNGFLPLSLAFSFFFMWAISGSGQPSSMVRLMAFKDAMTLRRSIFTVAIYYSMIYFPLVIIFCCARILLPGMENEPDRIMPAMAVFLTENIGLGWLAGLLVAAPFAAVMSTVDSFLLMISSSLVRDIYQRNIDPKVKEKTIKILSYVFTLIVGVGAMLGAVNPPQFLQDIIVYTGSGLAAAFLGPMVFALYWPRSNAGGSIAGMLAGFAAHLSMYCGGILANDSFFQPYRLFNFDPIIIGLVTSFTVTYVATLLTEPPPEDLVKKYFYKTKES
jgi:Na+/pantothenate symporter